MTQTKTTLPTSVPMDDGVPLPPPDPRLVAALRDAVSDVPYDAVDWQSMHQCIMGDAAGVLWQRRRRLWLTTVARWSRVVVPCGVTVALAAAVSLATVPAPEPNGGAWLDDAQMSVSPAMLISAVMTRDGDARAMAAGVTGVVQVDEFLARLAP